MGYTVPDWRKSIGQNMFDVEVDGVTYQLPRVEYLTAAQAQRMDGINEREGGVLMFLDELAPGLGSAFKGTPVKYLNEFVKAWQEDSGIALGESGASANS